jgi:hypothetical protein
MTIRTVKLDPTTWDLYEENGNQVIIEGVEAIRQILLCHLRTFLEEIFTDPTKGVPWIQSILGQKNPSLGDVGGLLRREILASPEIVGCGAVTVTVDDDTRGMSVSFTAQASTGETITVEDEELV